MTEQQIAMFTIFGAMVLGIVLLFSIIIFESFSNNKLEENCKKLKSLLKHNQFKILETGFTNECYSVICENTTTLQRMKVFCHNVFPTKGEVWELKVEKSPIWAWVAPKNRIL